jgi:DNA-binding transcriptional MerR regulator
MKKRINALTVGELARRIGCPVHKVEYLLRSRNIKPAFRAGNARVFSETTLEFLRSEIENRGSKSEVCDE